MLFFVQMFFISITSFFAIGKVDFNNVSEALGWAMSLFTCTFVFGMLVMFGILVLLYYKSKMIVAQSWSHIEGLRTKENY